MVNYENGKIYRIVCNKTGKQYIGATTILLSARLSQHKKLFNTKKTCLSREVIEGDDYAIYLIEDCPCERKEQLLSRERYYIETTDCVNKKIPLRTKHEWYMDNRDELIQRQLIWNSENADKLKLYNEKYRQKLRDIILNKQEITNTYDIDEQFKNFVCNIKSLSSNETPLNEFVDVSGNYNV